MPFDQRSASPPADEAEFSLEGLDRPSSLCGLPADLRDVAEPVFDLDRHATTRSLAALVAPPPALTRATDKPLEAAPALSLARIDATSLVSAVPASMAAKPSLQAPQLPFYHKSPQTVFRCATAAPQLVAELQAAFAAQSVQWSLNEAAVALSCEAYSSAFSSRVEVDVRVFRVADGQHQVEFQRQSGSRAAFSELLQALDGALPSCPSGTFGGASTPPRLHAALPLTAKTTASPLVVADSRGLARLAQTCPASVTAEALQAQLSAASPEDELAVLTAAAHLAAAAIVPEETMAWLEQLVSGGRVGEWLDGECPHTKREATRLLHNLAEHPDRTRATRFAAAVVRAGLVPSLELESSAGDDDWHTPDEPLRLLAQSTLVAVRH